ncbi:cytochrome b558/566 subunit B [Sulfolobales archaeon HS-7]|nr:cytochrome b558/566 subunit B [Sulfolobales archaeon HS-7]
MKFITGVVSLLLAGTILQFVFRDALYALIPLPLHQTFLNYLYPLGIIGSALFYVTIMVTLLILSLKLKEFLILFAIELVSSVIPYIYPEYYGTLLWYAFTFFLLFFSLGISLLEMGNSTRRELIFLVPIMLFTGYFYLQSILLYSHGPALTYSPLILLALLAAGTLSYSILLRSKKGKIIIAYISGALISIPFIFFGFLISGNAFLQTIMTMVIPSSLGITVNSSQTGITFALLGVILASLLIIGIKGEIEKVTGILLILTSVVQGATGFHFIVYLIAIPLGYFLCEEKLFSRLTFGRNYKLLPQQ